MNAPHAKARFWMVVGILVVAFVAISILALNRISSPPVSTQIRVSPTPSDWRTFVNAESRFSILFPRKPKESVETTTNRAGVMLVRQYYSELDRATAYGISVADLPLTNKFSEEQIQIMLDAGRNQALGTDGKLVAERKITLGRNLGREFDMEKLGGKRFVRVRVYIVQSRIYTLTSVGSSRDFILKGASKFLDTFSLIESSTNK